MVLNFKTANSEERQAEIRRIALEMGDDQSFTRKEIKYLPEALYDEEEVLGFCSGMMDNNTWLMVLTDKRVLMLDKGMFYGLKQTEFSLKNIDAVSHDIRLFFGKITIDVSSIRHSITQVPKKATANFVQRLRDAINDHANGAQPAGAATEAKGGIVDQLERLAALRDSGVLTPEEFATQKARILG